MSRSVLRVTVLTTAYLILLGLLGVSLPFALALNGFPLPLALLWTVVVVSGGAVYWWQVVRNYRNLPLGSRDSWFFTAGVLIALFAIGTGLITLSSFGAEIVTHSYCAEPKNVNVTSLNCKQIETVADASSNGPYVGWGIVGVFLILIGILAIPTFMGLALMFFVLSGRKPRKGKTSSSSTAP